MRRNETKFKETELGPIPEGWEVVALGDAVQIIDGDRGVNYPNGDDFTSGGYCLFLNTKNVPGDRFDFTSLQFISRTKDEGLGKGKLERGDFVLTTRGTVGNVAHYDQGVTFENIRINSGMVILRNDVRHDSFDSLFLLQSLRSKYAKDQLTALSTGSAQPQLPIRDLKNLRLICPPIDEQEQIAEILYSLDDKIELNRKMNANLEKMASAIFKRWFVDFEFPDENSRPYKSSGGRMIESELGEIPEGWSVKKTRDLMSVKGGSTPDTKKEEYWKDGIIHWATPRDLSHLNSLILLDTEKKITEDGLTTISSGLFPVGTILLSSRAPIGYVAVTNVPVAINQGFIAINAEKESFGYILFWVKDNIELIKSRANGSTFLEINKANFKDIDILVPDIDVLKSYQEFVDPLIETLIRNEVENRDLSRVREVLLPRLMSGRIRVSE